MLRKVEPSVKRREKRRRLPRKQRERIVVEMEMEEVEFLVVAFPADPFQHHHVQGVRIAHGAIEPQGFWPCRIEPG